MVRTEERCGVMCFGTVNELVYSCRTSPCGQSPEGQIELLGDLLVRPGDDEGGSGRLRGAGGSLVHREEERSRPEDERAQLSS